MADNNNPNLTPDEVAAIAMSKDPHDQELLKKLNPTEHGFLEQWYMKHGDSLGPVNDTNPLAMLPGFLGKAMPEETLPAIGGVIKSVARNPLVQSAGLILGSQLPQVPPALKPLMEMFGMMRGLGGGHGEPTPAGKPAFSTIPPMSDEEFLAQTGSARGMVRDLNADRVPRAMSPNMGRPNLDTTRTFGQATENMRQGGARVEGVTPEPAGANIQRGGPTTSRLRNPDGSTTGGLKTDISTNFRKEEFPPNTDNSTDPEAFKNAANASANKQVPAKDVENVKKKIRSTLRSPK